MYSYNMHTTCPRLAKPLILLNSHSISSSPSPSPLGLLHKPQHSLTFQTQTQYGLRTLATATEMASLPCPPHLTSNNRVRLKSKTRPARPELSHPPALQCHHPIWHHCCVTGHCKSMFVYFRFQMEPSGCQELRRMENPQQVITSLQKSPKT